MIIYANKKISARYHIQNYYQNQILIRYQFLPPFFSKSESKFESEFDFNAVFINLGICVFFILYSHSSK